MTSGNGKVRDQILPEQQLELGRLLQFLTDIRAQRIHPASIQRSASALNCDLQGLEWELWILVTESSFRTCQQRRIEDPGGDTKRCVLSERAVGRDWDVSLRKDRWIAIRIDCRVTKNRPPKLALRA